MVVFMKVDILVEYQGVEQGEIELLLGTKAHLQS